MSARKIGDRAEGLACKYLKSLGYKILERNYQIRGGEIDIVARDKNVLVFVEVKARWSHNFGEPFESIGYYKMRSLLKTALFYVNKVNWGERPYRIDALSLDFTENKESPKIELVKSVTS